MTFLLSDLRMNRTSKLSVFGSYTVARLSGYGVLQILTQPET